MYEENSSDSSVSGPDLSKIWKLGKDVLRQELDPQIFAAFIDPLEVGTFDSETAQLSLQAPSKLVGNHVTENFRDRIRETLEKHFGLNVSIRISSEKTGLESPIQDEESRDKKQKFVVVKKKMSATGATGAQSSYETNLNPKYTFANFVVGNNNQFCHAAAAQVSETPGQGYNPLFIYGGVGLGKTHLLHAIGNAALAHNPGFKVVYMSSETFTNELIQSLRFGKMDEFKSRMRNVNVLLIDDIQFMSGKERTQEEFFHTFNALYNAKNQIIITSDKIPQEIDGMEERLQTRFSWGLTADLQSPDFETRVAILNRKATLESFTIPREVAHYIAENISSNVRELEGALTRLHALSSLQKVPLTLELAETALKPLVKPKVVCITIDQIKQVVSDHFGIKVAEMVSKRRTKNLSFPRHVAMYLCRKHTTSSYPEIGTHFGNRDHSSVIHAANVVATKLKQSKELKQHIRDIEAKLMS